ncbi:hypothetical protein [Nocardioides sp.]|uniref:hypothetical protein n=1 Tax=Nocardioides sp. TaxID=35761 RepID=UPI00378413B1
MSTTSAPPSALDTQAGRTARRIGVVSALVHAGIVALGIFVAQQSGTPAYLLLSAAAFLGLGAALLGRASVTAGPGTWTTGVVLAGLSAGLLLGGLTSGIGLTLVSFGVSMLFVDYLLFSNARRALH